MSEKNKIKEKVLSELDFEVEPNGHTYLAIEKTIDKTLAEVIKEIDERIKNYKKGKLIDSNFTTEDRAVAMVVLENLKQKLSEEEE